MTVTVVVAGATGNLGSTIVDHLVRRGARVRALVRPGNVDGAKRLRAIAGDDRLQLVTGQLGDDVEALAGHLQGADIVVSAVQGGPEVIVDGQTALLRAAEAAGVARMIPSDFSVDLHRLDYGDNLFLDMRKKADESFTHSSVAPTYLLNGGFIDITLSPFMNILDAEQGTFSYWGDGRQPIDLTSIHDTAAYTAAAAIDESAAGRPIRVAGQTLTMQQLRREAEQGLGRSLTEHQLGTIADLEQEIERRKATAENPYEYVTLQYQWAMVTGKGKLDPLDNDRYPDITPTTVAQFLTAQREGR